MRGLFVLLGALGLVAISSPSFAEEQLLNLWPNQRAAHQVNMDAKAVEYQERGKAYNDFVYSTGGEQEFPAPDNLHAAESVGYPDQSGSAEVDPKEVNLGDVQSILSDKAQ